MQHSNLSWHQTSLQIDLEKLHQQPAIGKIERERMLSHIFIKRQE